MSKKLFFCTLILIVYISNNVVLEDPKIFMHVTNMCVEQTVSQNFDLFPFVYFMSKNINLFSYFF